MTKKEVLDMLDDMEKKILQSNGFIAGFVTESLILNMIRRKKAEVEDMDRKNGSSSDGE